jgi:hypothetical protein
MLVVVLMLLLSLAMAVSEFDQSGGGGGSGSPAAVAVAAAAVVAVHNRDRWRWNLIAVAALDGGHATTSQRSERVAQQVDKRVVQGEAMQQSANLPLRCHYNMRHCHLSSVAPSRHYPASL